VVKVVHGTTDFHLSPSLYSHYTKKITQQLFAVKIKPCNIIYSLQNCWS